MPSSGAPPRPPPPFSPTSPNFPPPLRHSHPDWLWKQWKKDFGPERAEELLAWNQEPAPTYLRANPLRPPGDRDPALVALPDHPGFFEATGDLPLAALEAGHFYVQDPSTAQAAALLAPQAGECVLDACAAPGGKASLMAGLMENRGELLCTDSNEKRLPRLTENLARLGVTISSVAAFDWTTTPPESWHRRFDAILLDVPCSNTGVLRRRVDVRWRLQADQLAELLQIQARILTHALPCLKPEGRLVYSTCSIQDEENAGQIARFLEQHPEFAMVDSRHLLPFRDGVDGAYAAVLRRK